MEQWRQNLGITNVEMRAGTLDAWGQDAELVQVRRRSWGLMPDPSNYVRGFYDIFTAPSSGGELVADAELEAMFAEMQMMSCEDPAVLRAGVGGRTADSGNRLGHPHDLGLMAVQCEALGKGGREQYAIGLEHPA